MSIMDFQEATAQRILHIFRDLKHNRVLLADEVGLGKTYVAKRVISLVREWHKSFDDFFKVVYVCSNANIAEQNIEKLGVDKLEVDKKVNISQYRLSMQHLFITKANREIRDKAAHGKMPESIIPLTPSTSFRLNSSQGTVYERALMFVLLSKMDPCKEFTDELSRFLSCRVKDWETQIDFYKKQVEESGDEYVLDITQKLSDKVSPDMWQKLEQYAKRKVSYQWGDKCALINAFRRAFAFISIGMLDPDLVILDEFQRFSDLLQGGEDEQSMLANEFFNPNRKNTKILLLSATPYKPLTTLEELNTDGRDEHLADFNNLINFLYILPEDSKEFRKIWSHYSSELKKCDDIPQLVKAKDEAQEALYKIMCRTERFNSGIIKDDVQEVPVQTEDILAYAEGQRLMDHIAGELGKKSLGNMPIEYVKSSPYLLSFMDKYELKTRIIGEKGKNIPFLRGCKMNALLLNKYRINNYKPVEPGNGKLRYLHDLVFGENHQKKTQFLLWVPASHPYYKTGGLFETEEARGFSKILLFSAWEMVPRMVSAMMSYYAELYTIGEIKKTVNSIRYTPDQTAGGKLKNRYGENRIRANSVFEYPSQTLAGLYDPKEYFGEKITEIRRNLSEKIKAYMDSDPVLSQLPHQRRSNAKCILAIMRILDHEEEVDTEGLYIPDNAVKVLTDIAIASPAVCAYRQSHDAEDARKAGKAIVSVFNKAESAAIIDVLYHKKHDDDYYESVLDYCVMGNLQSVLDEYAHMLGDRKLGDALEEAILDTGFLRVDTSDSIGKDDKKMTMRTHFAIPFIDKTVTDKSVARTKNIRQAFNSPFRPFILSSTSIGQEGLDFHWYARKIVHWNLPFNPVDLEQREGRVNRYKCLAIRRNVAHLYGDHFSWDEMFDEAKKSLKGNYSDMVPYWCLPMNALSSDQKSKLEYIERIVPLYPLSRDEFKYKRLIDVLSLYRLSLGQPRQEELIDMFEKRNISQDVLHQLTMNLCPFDRLKK